MLRRHTSTFNDTDLEGLQRLLPWLPEPEPRRRRVPGGADSIYTTMLYDLSRA